MMTDEIDEVIASANNLLASIYRDLDASISPRQNRRNLLTVSAEAQRQLDCIDRCLRDIPNGTDGEASATTASINDSVQIVEPVNRQDGLTVSSLIRRPLFSSQEVPSTANEDSDQNVRSANTNAPPSRPSHHAEVIDVIDLCGDSPIASARNNRQSNLPEVIILETPTNTSRVRRRRPLASDSNNAHHTPCKRSPDNDAEKTQHPGMICAICMEAYASRQPVTTKCGHIYCKRCITQSLKIKPNCPICRTKISSNTLIRLHL